MRAPSQKCLFSLSAPLITGLIFSACQTPTGNPTPGASPTVPFTYSVDAAVKPEFDLLGNGKGGAPRPVVAYVDSKGIRTDFVASEIVVSPKDAAELNTILAAYGGTVIEDDSIPQPPAELNIKLTDAERAAKTYTIRITKPLALDNFEAEGDAKGMSGAYQFSNDAAAKLLATVNHERLMGRSVMPNWVYRSSGSMMYGTQELPMGGGYGDAFSNGEFKNKTWGDSNHSTVWAAWQFMSAKGVTPQSVRVAVIDGGFWLDNAGHPNLSPAGIGTDLPPSPIQYDFAGDDYIAEGPNLAKCTGGSTCNWHGNGSVSVVAGFVNNQAAAAGTGGQVAEPMLFKVDMSFAQVRRAIRTVLAWNAQVASMSFGGQCNDDCQDYKDDNHFYEHIQEALDAGIVLVAAAGNDNTDVQAGHYEPCLIGGVICVGALNDGKNTRISYSNFGDGVHIYAPTDIPAMPNGDNPNALANHNGTSASCPFVAGVAVMMKSLNPSLNSGQVRDMLMATAWNTYPDNSADADVAKVGYLNALKAVEAAAGYQLGDDSFEPNNTIPSAHLLTPGDYNGLTLKASQWDYYRFTLSDFSVVTLNLDYMVGLGHIFMTLTPESGLGNASDAVETNLTQGGATYTALLPPGTYRVLLSAYGPQYYNMHFNAVGGALTPDMFEDNNTFTTPASPGSGEWSVNLHQNADVDYYKFTIPSKLLPGMTYYSVGIDQADFPVQFSYYDAATKAYINGESGQKVIFTFDKTDAGKTLVFRVSGQKTRYNLSAGTVMDTKQIPVLMPENPFVWNPIDPGPWDGIITGPIDWLIFTGNQGMGSLDLAGAGLHAKVMDTNGAVIAEGVDTLGGERQRPGMFETVGFNGAIQPGQTYLIQISRKVGADAPVDGTTQSFPAVNYSLMMNAGS